MFFTLFYADDAGAVYPILLLQLVPSQLTGLSKAVNKRTGSLWCAAVYNRAHVGTVTLSVNASGTLMQHLSIYLALSIRVVLDFIPPSSLPLQRM